MLSYVTITLEQCIMQHLSLANSSIRPCSEISPRDTVHMKAKLLTPLEGKWNTVRKKSGRANTHLSSAWQRWKTDMNEITLRKRQKEAVSFCFFLFVLWTLFSHTGGNLWISYCMCQLGRWKPVSHSVKLLFISKYVCIGLEKSGNNTSERILVFTQCLNENNLTLQDISV